MYLRKYAFWFWVMLLKRWINSVRKKGLTIRVWTNDDREVSYLLMWKFSRLAYACTKSCKVFSSKIRNNWEPKTRPSASPVGLIITCGYLLFEKIITRKSTLTQDNNKNYFKCQTYQSFYPQSLSHIEYLVTPFLHQVQRRKNDQHASRVCNFLLYCEHIACMDSKNLELHELLRSRLKVCQQWCDYISEICTFNVSKDTFTYLPQ